MSERLYEITHGVLFTTVGGGSYCVYTNAADLDEVCAALNASSLVEPAGANAVMKVGFTETLLNSYGVVIEEHPGDPIMVPCVQAGAT